jgi:outer membrane protein TolC
MIRRALAVTLCCGLLASAQQTSIAPVRPPAPVIVRPYLAAEVPGVRTSNSPRLGQLVRGGALYLTAQDAIALALENNIDLEVSRYNPIIGEWRVTRAEAGGALPGVTTGASQAGTVASGQGVAGSQAAAGVSIAGTGGIRGASTNATVQQIGPVTQTLDPSIQETSTFSHTSTPQPNSIQSVVQSLVANSRANSGSYQQGFLSGGSVNAGFRETYLNENSPTDVLNPSVAPNATLAAQHNFLRGFGIAVNARNITVAKMNLEITDLSFRSQVISLVSQVLNLYYGLSSAYEDVKAKRVTADVASAFVKNVKEQIELGAVAPPEELNATSQMVTAVEAVSSAEASLKQQEIRLKNLISRNGTADPLIASVRIVPVDKAVIPPADDLPPIDEMVKQARANRADLLTNKQSEAISQVSILGTRNGVLPSLQAFGALSQAGLAGVPRTVVSQGRVIQPDAYFVGGLGTALGQVFRRNFPTERIGAFFTAQLRNDQAQADYAIDLLQLRQSQLQSNKNLNQVEVDVLNNVVAMQQARARYDAAVKNRQLQEELFKGEQTRFSLGASAPYDVTRQQRDLVTAQSTELSAIITYTNARLALDQTLGRTLEVNHVTIDEARSGRVMSESHLPPGN